LKDVENNLHRFVVYQSQVEATHVKLLQGVISGKLKEEYMVELASQMPAEKEHRPTTIGVNKRSARIY
jgi:hypothetical protein